MLREQAGAIDGIESKMNLTDDKLVVASSDRLRPGSGDHHIGAVVARVTPAGPGRRKRLGNLLAQLLARIKETPGARRRHQYGFPSLLQLRQNPVHEQTLLFRNGQGERLYPEV